ncbi:hypothetical protein NIES4073_73720 [Kalymmatonema gypsitolerans NIES-4073]|nr:hypothetical protein NIES4073_73720 [Scytonema sp. NIES-4073]
MAACYTKFTKPFWKPGYWVVGCAGVFLGLQAQNIRYTDTLLASYRTKPYACQLKVKAPFLGQCFERFACSQSEAWNTIGRQVLLKSVTSRPNCISSLDHRARD